MVLLQTNQMYQIFPAYDKRTCWLGEVSGGCWREGPLGCG